MSHSLLLLHSGDEPYASRCRQLFAEQIGAGARVQELAASHQIGADTSPNAADCAPDQIVVCAPATQAWAWIAAQSQPATPPLTLLSDWPAAAAMTSRPLHLIAGWWPLDALQPDQAAAALAMDKMRWQQARRADQTLHEAHQRLEDRKWVERAKGLLSEARGIAEDQAYSLLRNTAMQAHLKLGHVSRQLVEATERADAVNRAGQFRMLSQRLVKLQAMRLADIDTLTSTQHLRDAFDKGAANLRRLQTLRQHLGASEPMDQALTAVERQWRQLVEGFGHGISPASSRTELSLEALDQQAGRLLAAAEHLTEVLEQLGARQALHVINLCGRQRMHVQRLAKDALLAHLLGRERPAAIEAQVFAFDSALKDLEQLPLSNPEIRYLLSESRLAWLALTEGLARDPSAQGLNALVHASDTLLQLLEQLTSAYEHSLQVMLG